jgi:hypothetical protein
MSKTALTLAVLLSAASPTPALPPDAPSGAMVYERVREELRQHSTDKDVQCRIKRLKRLAPTGDPRLVMALIQPVIELRPGGIASGLARDELLNALDLLERYYMPPPPEKVKEMVVNGGVGPYFPSGKFQTSMRQEEAFRSGSSFGTAKTKREDADLAARKDAARYWWWKNEADLRRRAKQLPP